MIHRLDDFLEKEKNQAELHDTFIFIYLFAILWLSGLWSLAFYTDVLSFFEVLGYSESFAHYIASASDGIFLVNGGHDDDNFWFHMLEEGNDVAVLE